MLRSTCALLVFAAGVCPAVQADPADSPVAVARQRVRKGSPMSCDDIALANVPVRSRGKHPMRLPCNLEAGSVALRELGAGDAVNDADVGVVNGVLAGEAVDVRLHVGAVTVTTVGTALADARAGEPAQVALRHPTRTLQAHVVARSVVELQEPHQ